MTERPEFSESIRSQFRTLAVNGSFDGAWHDPNPQRVSLERRVSVPGEDEAELFGGFTAERFYLEGTQRLQTRYDVYAGISYDNVPEAFWPDYVTFALMQRRLHEWDPANGNVALIVPSEGTGTDEQEVVQLLRRDCLDVSDTPVRFERRIGFEFDGRAQVLREKRFDAYFTVDDGRQIAGTFGAIPHTHPANDLVDRWIEKDVDGVNDIYTMDLLQHPDLRKLEYTYERNSFQDFMTFAELVQRVEQDRRLDKISRQESQQKILSMLAFLRLEASAADIYAMLYE